ncbi:hypothetical protein F0U60_51110 [Archangium minus]|uniref:Uncharacterized protein n=1 Tax=Archangium minus TaxID=83450 RepID=A0ABY9X844_9BACT|nr:hypothetical protein F0U60_51110 [Archangium minus]
MGKIKQGSAKGGKGNTDDFKEEDLRQPKADSIERDKRHGYDHKNGTKDGKSVSYALWDTPPTNKELVYVKKADHTFVFSPRPKNDLNQRNRGRATLPHSMLGAGEAVIGAGECETNEEGKITRADNFSGHYQPNEKNLKETKKNFEQQGHAAGGAKYEVFDRTGKVIKSL